MESAAQRSIPFPEAIEGPRVTLVAVRPDHAERLWEIRDEPEVHRWWGPVDPDFPFDEDGDDTPGFVVVLDGQVIGFVQFSEDTDPMYKQAGIDLFLSSAFHGQRLGREVVAVLAAHLIDVRGHHRITIDPAAANERAIAAYSAVGFRPVGVMRQYERSPEGEWRDGLLMDLLADELVRVDQHAADGARLE